MLSSRPTPLHGDRPPQHATIARTPGRTILRGRSALQENAIHGGAMTVNIKAKKTTSGTSFQPTTIQPQRLFKDPSAQPSVKSLRVLSTTHAPSRPLLDKTPFQNRTASLRTPLHNSSKLPKLSLLEHDTGALLHPHDTPESLLRPSSTRTHIRVPRSASRSFETPLNQGNHWDVSDVSISLPEMQLQAPVVEEDYDEIEYIPPRAPDPPYKPPLDFDLPDYKTVGATLLNLTRSCHFDDTSPPELDVHDEDFGFSSPLKWEMLTLPKLDDDSPFHEPKPKQETKSGPQKRLTAAPVPRPKTSAPPRTRVSSIASTTTTHTSRTVNSRVSRPVTSAPSAVPTPAPRSRPILRQARIQSTTSATTAASTRKMAEAREPSRPAVRTATNTAASLSARSRQTAVATRPVVRPGIVTKGAITAKTSVSSSAGGKAVDTTNRVLARRPVTSAAKPATRAGATRMGVGVGTGVKRNIGKEGDKGKEDDMLPVLRFEDVGEEDFKFDI